jgi:hypothetical protein
MALKPRATRQLAKLDRPVQKRLFWVRYQAIRRPRINDLFPGQ